MSVSSKTVKAPSRIGVYICECGPNLKGALDVPRLITYAGTLEGVVSAKPFPLFCSEEGRRLIIEEIDAQRLDRVVIAACSPKEHEQTFKDALVQGGLNPYLLQLVNIREQCAWVTPDRHLATEKAVTLLSAAVARVKTHVPLESKSVECRTDVLVVGAGMAGISAALSLAQDQRKVYLVEKFPYVGGHAVCYEDWFPETSCATCQVSQQLDEVLHHGKIDVLTLSEVEAVLGYWGNFTVRIRKKARYIDEKACLGCRACLDVCPVSVPNEFNVNLDRRKAVYFPYDSALPNIAAIDASTCLRYNGTACSACREACPFGAVAYEQADEVISLDVGAVILATGFDLFDPISDRRYGYGEMDEIYTAIEFERILNQNGPTGGNIEMKNGKTPRRIALIHCVGSRTEAHHTYCSGVCCAYLLKYALQIHAQNPGIEIEQVYADLCLPGKGLHQLLRKTNQLSGHTFHRMQRPDAITMTRQADGISISYTDEHGHPANFSVDMAVLAPAMIGAASARGLGELFFVDRDADGFWDQPFAHFKPVATRMEGVYVAGCGQGPMDIPGSVAQGQAAAGCVLQELIPGKTLALQAMAAVIDPCVCSGCKTCLSACQFGAIDYDAGQKQASINPLLCRACGMCAVACPGGAVSAMHFTDSAITAEIHGLLKKERGGSSLWGNVS